MSQVRRGFVIPLIALFLFLLAILGIAYFRQAQNQGQAIFREAERMRARNLAQAGFEKALLFLQRKYSYGEYDVQFPSKFVKESFAKEFDREIKEVGRYKVLSIRPFSYSTGVFSVSDYVNVPYIKDRKVLGRYDIWEVQSEGVTEHRVRATLRTLVKLIRQETVY